MCANGRLYVLSGSLSLLCAIKLVFVSLLRLDVTDRLALGTSWYRGFLHSPSSNTLWLQNTKKK